MKILQMRSALHDISFANDYRTIHVRQCYLLQKSVTHSDVNAFVIHIHTESMPCMYWLPTFLSPTNRQQSGMAYKITYDAMVLVGGCYCCDDTYTFYCCYALYAAHPAPHTQHVDRVIGCCHMFNDNECKHKTVIVNSIYVLYCIVLY